jgi:hypothetical protein
MDWDTAKAIATGLIEFWFLPVPILLLLSIFRRLVVKK